MQPVTPFNRVPRDALDPALLPMWDATQALHGDTTFVEVMGNAPAVTRWYTDSFYGDLFHSGRVDRKVLELVRLRLANLHGCAFCNRSDRLAARAAGLSDAEIDAIGDYAAGPFDARQQSALELADVMALTNLKGAVSRPLYDRLKQHFSDAELVELGVVMAVLTGMAKFIFAYDLVEKEDYCPLV
ncbi:carboxymuconolactone decarboxylase family protein [Sphingomonas radiodurans]|uniref:carboxymuconolactone decarboxylase family protein n=1 Tax=Sphingomonas radiodurans TaxID=2890321 RepID=UPI001E4DE229|nr:carboxymuconolactone decarboxylase family protein [Sphingomonas radiodurans]WBH17996.1 carboxymuconolactone decarboxylase family protein [Sphingomonas radiodurans]